MVLFSPALSLPSSPALAPVLTLLVVVPIFEATFLEPAPALAEPAPNLDPLILEVLLPSASFFSFSAIFSLSIFYFSTRVCRFSSVPVGFAIPDGFLNPPILEPEASEALEGACRPVFGFYGETAATFSASLIALVSFLLFWAFNSASTRFSVFFSYSISYFFSTFSLSIPNLPSSFLSRPAAGAKMSVNVLLASLLSLLF